MKHVAEKAMRKLKKNSEFTKRIRGSVNKSECYTLHYENKVLELWLSFDYIPWTRIL